MPQVTLIDTTEKPLFLRTKDGHSFDALNYYRAVLPARMTGGAVRHWLEASRDGGPFERFDFYEPRDTERLLNSKSIALMGLGRPTVILGRKAVVNPWVTEFIRLVNSGDSEAVWLSWDDDLGPYVASELECAIRQLEHFDRRLTTIIATQWATKALHEGVESIVRSVYTAARRHIVATEPLRSELLKVNPDAIVTVGPNAIDPGDVPTEQRASGRPVRVGYSGTRTHNVDICLATDSLFAAARDGAEIFLCGWHPRLRWNGVEPGRYRSGDMTYVYGGEIVGYQEFHSFISGFDVAIAPLVDSTFNRCKSPQKWFEHSLHGTPMVVSDLPVYSCIEHGVTGFKARNSRQFSEYLGLLCSDAGLRARMGQAARDAVMSRHTTAHYAEQWRRAVAPAAEAIAERLTGC